MNKGLLCPKASGMLGDVMAISMVMMRFWSGFSIVLSLNSKASMGSVAEPNSFQNCIVLFGV